MEKKSVAILYICTGAYTVFWKNFYESAERFLLPGFNKTYFVFTDKKEIFNSNNQQVKLVFQESLQWPYPTLFRFKFFKGIEAQLAGFDYVYFFNANCRIEKEITGADFLPAEDEEMVVTQHPGYWNKNNNEFTYERNPASTAFVPQGDGIIYAAGGLNGGRTQPYLRFINTGFASVEADLQNGIIAIWHDESHLNKYILDKKVKVLHPGFLYPDGAVLPFERMIHLENKKLFIKGRGKYSLLHKIKKLFQKKEG